MDRDRNGDEATTQPVKLPPPREWPVELEHEEKGAPPSEQPSREDER